jgi:hypothetical protein
MLLGEPLGVTVTPDARDPFAFEPHVIARWKYW